MKLYICGKISGDKNYKRKFEAAKILLKKWGYEACNPAQEVSAATWETAMKICITLMLKCDGVAVLPDWEQSRGATLESYIATESKIRLLPITEWKK